MVVRRGRGRGSGPSQHHDACTRSRRRRDAGANHHFRAAIKHRVLDTLFGQSKLIVEVARREIEWCEGSEGAGARQRTVTVP